MMRMVRKALIFFCMSALRTMRIIPVTFLG